MVRVRFAPSPTGYLHVGGLRTALYNYLFAKHNDGKLILRIEDTDQSRFVLGASENLITMLRWAGIEFDESPEIGGEFGPYIQSERFDLYKQYGKKLIENGSAYYAFDTSEELDAMRQRQQKAGIAPKYDRSIMRNEFTLGAEETQRLVAEGALYVVRLKVPITGEVRFKDIVRGDIIVLCRDIDDQVLLKSDGFPTYHLANVVDDHFMEISHVIRGEEWLPSTPKHVLLYQAFGWTAPQFAHLSLLLNPDKSKLSKRQGDVAVEDYKAKGFFPDALVNFVALCGWNPTADREIFTMEEMISLFDLEKVNKAGAVFDIKKLDWMNSQYLRAKNPAELAQELLPLLENAGFSNISAEFAEKVFILVRERITKLTEIPTFANYMFAEPQEFDAEYVKKHWTEETPACMKPLIEKFVLSQNFSHQELHDITQNYALEIGAKLGTLIHPLRLMITGKSVGAGMFETMEVLGKEESLRRISNYLAKI